MGGEIAGSSYPGVPPEGNVKNPISLKKSY